MLRNLQVGRGDPVLVVCELLLDELPGELRLPLALAGQTLEELLARELLNEPDADDPALAVVRGPLHVDGVGQDGRELAQGRDVDRPWGALGLHVRLVRGDGVGQGAHLA